MLSLFIVAGLAGALMAMRWRVFVLLPSIAILALAGPMLAGSGITAASSALSVAIAAIGLQVGYGACAFLLPVAPHADAGHEPKRAPAKASHWQS
ncbi:MAG: hypothetical protein HXY30_19630 [Pseudorhodoplanes sp.]|nr:hypothetical protein [Pseudorhodoplanes sp.]